MTTPENGSNRPDEDPEITELRKLSLGQWALLQLPDLKRRRGGSSESTVAEEPEPPVAKPKPTRPVQKKLAPPMPKPVKAPRVEQEATDESSEGEPEALDAESADSENESESTALEPAPSQKRSSSSTGRSRSTSTMGNNPFESKPTPELLELVKKLDDRERKLAIAAVPLGVVLGIVVTIVTLHSNPALHKKGHENSSLILTDGALPIAFSAVVFFCAWYRRRSLTAFSLLFLGLTLGLIGPGTPFLVLGGYLIFRMFRVQKVLTSRGVNTRAQNPRTRSQATTRDGSTRDTSRPTTRSKRQPVPDRPQQSKRYTPPKPPPRRPPVPVPDPEAKPKRSFLERMAERVDRPQE